MRFVVLREGSVAQYLSHVAMIHKLAYHRGHFSSCFSVSKLEEYYANLIANSDISLVAIDEDEQCAGFVIAGYSVSQGTRKFTRDNKIYLAMLLLLNPSILLTKLHGRVCSLVGSSEASFAKFRLLSISVNPSSQSSGVGSAMLTFFEERLREMNVDYYGLSVKGDNTNAIRFYEKNGFIEEKEDMGSRYFYKLVPQEEI